MSDTEYTPTLTGDVRHYFNQEVRDLGVNGYAAFDRALAAHDAQVRAEALREAARDLADIMGERDRLRATLDAVRELVEECEFFTAGNCASYGRNPNSVYSADGYCQPCLVRHILDGGEKDG